MLFDKNCHKIVQFVFGNDSKEPFDSKFTFFDFREVTVNETLIKVYSYLIVIKMCSHSREVTEYLTSFSTDIFVRLLKLNLLSVFTPNISTSLFKFANLKLCWSMFWWIHIEIFHGFVSYNFGRTNQSLSISHWTFFDPLVPDVY